MDPQQEKYVEPIYGTWRARIETINMNVMNGIYQVRVYPYFQDIDTDLLPWAQSNFTTQHRHIQLKVGQWVWVFFEGGDRDIPIITDVCNVKGKYPTPSGTSEYGAYDKFQFGDDNEMSAEYDETNKILTIDLSAVGGTIKIVTPGSIIVNGSVIPTGQGPWCGLPLCLMTGSPQTGPIVQGTGE